MPVVLLILRWLLYAAEIALALPVFYLVLLSISALIASGRRQRQRTRERVPADSARVNFGLLLPAHNEEQVLNSLLESLAALDYPKECYTVYVVADNCTDGTAALARASGWVRVYERSDQTRRGKGYALNWIVQRLEDEQRAHDAYVVLDADSVVDPALLQAFARELAQGAEAAQAYNGVLNISDSPSSALRWIALALVNHVRPLGRNGLGSSSTLTGNGMCLRRSLLQRHPWQAFTIGEDYQYYLTVMEQGVRVRYVPEAIVRSEMPVTFDQMKTQDVRWESAGSQPTWRIALSLARAGLRARDLARLEAVAELLTPPLSVLVAGCALTLLASILLWTLPGVLGSLGLILGLLVYIVSPLYLLRPPRAVYLALLHAPVFILWKLWVVVALRRSKKHTSEWVRTSRGVSENQVETR
jgi:cellulose synthase/poly-beta-1,6-N-acetylglucosamine synthase-like glycosyltransferase